MFCEFNWIIRILVSWPDDLSAMTCPQGGILSLAQSPYNIEHFYCLNWINIQLKLHTNCVSEWLTYQLVMLFSCMNWQPYIPIWVEKRTKAVMDRRTFFYIKDIWQSGYLISYSWFDPYRNDPSPVFVSWCERSLGIV